MRKLSALLLTTALLTSVAFQPALAQEWHGRGDGYGFHDHGDHWRAGRWFNGFHDGRNGWWWIVDGAWYFYPAPVYPYPDPYTPPTVVIETVPGAPSGAQTYYYCASPAGYYPSVPQCTVAWQKVVATPTAHRQSFAPAPQPPPQAIVPVGNQHDIDLQQLNAYAAKLQSIDYKDSHVRARLKDLEKQVEAFRQSLYKRSYNAMGMLRDTEDLKKRIDEQRKWLAEHKGAIPPAPLPPGSTVTFPPPPVTGAPPPPAPLPPGSTVTFPPPPQ
ncbi:MAG: hypothetical protein WCD70_03090 [Alphaproteobacteria bacterium]